MDIHEKNKFITLEDMSVDYQSNHCTVYQYEDDIGSCIVALHEVFPGIDFVYREFRRPNCVLRLRTPGPHLLVVEQCQEGRVECQLEPGFFHLEAGDVVIRRTDGRTRDISFPVNYYRGVDFIINFEQADIDTEQLLSGTQVSLGAILKKYHMEEGACYFFRQNPHMKYIFSELYSVPKTVKDGYLRIKVLELLLFLTGTEPENVQPVQRIPARQVNLAKEVNEYLAEHITTHITIEQLTQKFNVSATRLKDCFKGVYGMSVQTFISEQRIRTAAEVLKQTDRTVADVAGEFGYANASKFSAAFRRVMGETPTQYRSKQNNLQI